MASGKIWPVEWYMPDTKRWRWSKAFLSLHRVRQRAVLESDGGQNSFLISFPLNASLTVFQSVPLARDFTLVLRTTTQEAKIAIYSELEGLELLAALRKVGVRIAYNSNAAVISRSPAPFAFSIPPFSSFSVPPSPSPSAISTFMPHQPYMQQHQPQQHQLPQQPIASTTFEDGVQLRHKDSNFLNLRRSVSSSSSDWRTYLKPSYYRRSLSQSVWYCSPEDDLTGESTVDGSPLSKYTPLTTSVTPHLVTPTNLLPPTGTIALSTPAQPLLSPLGATCIPLGTATQRLPPTEAPPLGAPTHQLATSLLSPHARRMSPPSMTQSPPAVSMPLAGGRVEHSGWSLTEQSPYGTLPRSPPQITVSQSSLFRPHEGGRSMPRFMPKLRPAKSESSLAKELSSPKLDKFSFLLPEVEEEEDEGPATWALADDPPISDYPESVLAPGDMDPRDRSEQEWLSLSCDQLDAYKTVARQISSRLNAKVQFYSAENILAEEDTFSLNLKRGGGRAEELALRTGSGGMEEDHWDSSEGNLADVDSPPVRGSGFTSEEEFYV